MSKPDHIKNTSSTTHLVTSFPVAIVGAASATIMDADGNVESCNLSVAARKLSDTPHIVCNAPLVARRLGLTGLRAYDALELFAFYHPAQFCVPTVSGLSKALKLPITVSEAEQLKQAVKHMLDALGERKYPFAKRAKPIAAFMKSAGWSWGDLVYNCFAAQQTGDVAVWRSLPEWEEKAPRPRPDDISVDTGEALSRLSFLLGEGAEHREAQDNYTREACYAFSQRVSTEAPNIIALEAGTGIGKTLGYIAPASLWAEKNDGSVWLSTYTKNLQRQIDQELDKLYKDKKTKAEKAVVRKGRENYLCLLNLEEAMFKGKGTTAGAIPHVLLGLVLRWVTYTRDGDMVGGDFPSWLAAHFGGASISSISDRRGECIYSACQHYRKCFVERSKKRAKQADLVITNHALVMHEAALNNHEDDFGKRFVFDEGHHLFDAADSAFALSLSGLETRELRRWLWGNESRGGRARGLRSRVDDLLVDDKKAMALIDEILEAARVLPEDGWLGRLQSDISKGEVEVFLSHVRTQVQLRASGKEGPHSLEAGIHEPQDGLVETAADLQQKLILIANPLKRLAKALRHKLETEAEELSSGDRGRLDSVARSLSQRADVVMGGWIPMLGAIGAPVSQDFVHWFFVERGQWGGDAAAREFDVGLKRHWLDPSKPFAESLLERAHGVIVTSATLRDRAYVASDEGEASPLENWKNADIRMGATHLVLPPKRKSFTSPFNYGENTRVYIVGDVNRNSLAEVSDAYRSLFQAAGGGGLGLFTAISRLKAVYHRIAAPLEAGDISLLAQHVDPMDAGTLVDMFRDDISSCLLGTDALRDGVDVPGEALKLIVFDRVPWSRPDILHRARKMNFGGTKYDEMMVRLRLKQAFGRLVRRKTDRGVFIMLEGRTPTRLLDAFPEDTPVERIGLKEAVTLTKDFLWKG
ncbi:MAG: ATP-dependent DNA helicase [Sphingomonadales bacterium]|nr:ATP-dependent DNA helicase [Sphingomonadales bacterium]